MTRGTVAGKRVVLDKFDCDPRASGSCKRGGILSMNGPGTPNASWLYIKSRKNWAQARVSVRFSSLSPSILAQ